MAKLVYLLQTRIGVLSMAKFSVTVSRYRFYRKVRISPTNYIDLSSAKVTFVITRGRFERQCFSIYDLFDFDLRTVPSSMAKHVCPKAKFVLSMAMLLLPIHFRQKQTLYRRPETIELSIVEPYVKILYQ